MNPTFTCFTSTKVQILTLVVVLRGAEGFVCVNLAKSWLDVPVLRFSGTELHGTYSESVYGFSCDIDGEHQVVSWGGEKGSIKIGPESALVFTRVSFSI